MVLSRTIKGTRVLLLSDLGRLGQEALLKRTPDLRADIVVTGIPTRPEAIDDALLAEIQPRIIVVADSEFPVSERASKALRDRLSQYKLPVIYTREAGAVSITFRQKRWELRTMNGTRVTDRSVPQRFLKPDKTESVEP